MSEYLFHVQSRQAMMHFLAYPENAALRLLEGPTSGGNVTAWYLDQFEGTLGYRRKLPKRTEIRLRNEVER
jgi:hypothetical protein